MDIKTGGVTFKIDLTGESIAMQKINYMLNNVIK
jgi:hypothetical protein